MDLHKLPALRSVWRCYYGAVGLVIGLLGGAALAKTSELAPFIPAGLAGAALLGLAGLLYAGRAYAAYDARLLQGEGVVVQKGVWWREEIMVPLARLQHIDLNQGPLDRRWAMAKLTLYTAGTHDSGTTIEGLPVEQAHALRDILLPRQPLAHD